MAYPVLKGDIMDPFYGRVEVKNISSKLIDELTLIAIQNFNCTGVQNQEVNVDEIPSAIEVPDEILTMSGEFTERQSEIVESFFFSKEQESAFFFFEGKVDEINEDANSFISFLTKEVKLSASLSLVDNQDWRDSYKVHFSGAVVDKNLVILPFWKKNPKEFLDFSKKLYLIPGMGFGTGSHETTSSCLRVLNQLSNIDTVLDLGCGSGILGNFCEKYLGSCVSYVDVDLDALENCRQNRELNKLQSGSKVVSRDDFFLDTSYDLVIANILKPVLELESSLIMKALSCSGKIIFSGLLDNQYLDLVNFYQKKFNVVFDYEKYVHNEWATIFVKKIKRN